jgi:UDP-glucose 4-epimerase
LRVLVTGGAGYLGNVVTEELLNDGPEVVVFDSLIKGHRAAADRRAKFVEGDLMNPELLPRTLKENAVQAVIHLGRIRWLVPLKTRRSITTTTWWAD